MERERFEEMLDKVQALQRETTIHGIHSFIVRTAYWKADPELGDEPDELDIDVTVFLRGDDVEPDYYSCKFYESESAADWFRAYNNLKAFVSCFL